jgi:hypothetical protein
LVACGVGERKIDEMIKKQVKGVALITSGEENSV